MTTEVFPVLSVRESLTEFAKFFLGAKYIRRLFVAFSLFKTNMLELE
jgi:hypothetical protein